MSLINFSDLQVSTSASNNDQILLRLNNSLSGAEGFSRITFSNFENSLTVFSNTLSSTAWVDKAGNDSIGEIGNPLKPYLTMQAAYNAGGKVLYIGEGTFSGITKAANIDLSILGAGANKTTIQNISAANTTSNTYTITIQDLGSSSAIISEINSIGLNAPSTETSGRNGGNITLTNVRASYIYANGGNGGDGGVTNPGGFPGGNGGNLNINGECYISTINNKGGNGGNAYDDGNETSGGIGGNGGSVSGYTLYVLSFLDCSGGEEGGSVNGGSSTGGSPGNITLKNLDAETVSCLVGGTVNAVNSNDILLNKGYITTLNMTNSTPGNPGSIDGANIYIDTLNIEVSNPPLIYAVLSYINGTPYGT